MVQRKALKLDFIIAQKSAIHNHRMWYPERFAFIMKYTHRNEETYIAFWKYAFSFHDL